MKLSNLETLARAATPQDFDSAKEEIRIGGFFECPLCGGEGEVELSVDYCNYDNAAMGVQFYGIGKEFGTAEAYYRAANPATILALCEIIRAQHAIVESVAHIGVDFGYGPFHLDAGAPHTKMAIGDARAALAKANEVMGGE